MPGHYIVSLAHFLHPVIPWCPFCIKPKTELCLAVGMTCLESLSSNPSWTMSRVLFWPIGFHQPWKLAIVWPASLDFCNCPLNYALVDRCLRTCLLLSGLYLGCKRFSSCVAESKLLDSGRKLTKWLTNWQVACDQSVVKCLPRESVWSAQNPMLIPKHPSPPLLCLCHGIKCHARTGLFPKWECHPYDTQLPVVYSASVGSTPQLTICQRADCGSRYIWKEIWRLCILLTWG